MNRYHLKATERVPYGTNEFKRQIWRSYRTNLEFEAREYFQEYLAKQSTKFGWLIECKNVDYNIEKEFSNES